MREEGLGGNPMCNSCAFHFTPRYVERVTLADGTRVTLRLIRPDDKEMFLRGFEALSPESRYRRFFSYKRSLSYRELRYFTEPDGVDHVAIVALASSEAELVGVARFARLAQRGDIADAAFVVLDREQDKGLGRLLLNRLVAAARERGVERFECSVLTSNEPMRHLLDSLAPPATVHADGEVVTFQVPLSGGGTVSPETR
jgi:GNAT superfamily N-acetyltransferase